MSCCGKAKAVVSKAKNIAVGYSRLETGKRYEWTDDRIRVCQKCEKAWWRRNKRSLWCKLCLCYIPAKARVEEEKCPLNKWDKKVKE